MPRQNVSAARLTTGRKSLLVAVLVPVVVVLATLALGESERRPQYISEVSLSSVAGKDVPSAELNGIGRDFTLVNIFASWCGYCRDELPALNEFHRQLISHGGGVALVTVDNPSAVSLALSLRDDLAPDLALYRGDAREVRSRFSGFGVPFSLLLDGDGRILQTIPGAHDWDSTDLENILAMAGRPTR